MELPFHIQMEVLKWKFHFIFKWKFSNGSSISYSNGSSILRDIDNRKDCFFEIELCYNMRHRKAFERSPMTSLFRTTTTKKSESIMSKIDTISLIDLCHCLQRAEALIQVLGEALSETENSHHVLMVEIIEEYLLRARKTLGDR
jgi:hypothetical protein